MQRNFNFSVYFNALSLVNPNNLLTHTFAPSVTKIFFLLAYAREVCCNPCKQRTSRSFLCSLFMPFCELDFKQNKNEITAVLIKKVMRKEQTKRDYSAPACMIIQVSETTNLMDTSFPSQHRPGHHGGTISSAKSSMPWEEEENP